MLKVISQKWSLSSSTGGCLSWCFGSGQATPDRRDYLDPNGDVVGDGSDSPPPPYTSTTTTTNGGVPESYTNGAVVLGKDALAHDGGACESGGKDDATSYALTKASLQDGPAAVSKRRSSVESGGKSSGIEKGTPPQGARRQLARDDERRGSSGRSSKTKGSELPPPADDDAKRKVKRGSSRASNSAKEQETKRASPVTGHDTTDGARRGRGSPGSGESAAVEKAAGKRRGSQSSSQSGSQVKEGGDPAGRRAESVRSQSQGSSSTPNVSTHNVSGGSDTLPITDGSAYAYDDAETSSDSDDEVLRRYQQTMGMQRAPSKHSIRSSKSTKSTTSRASRASRASKKSKVGTVTVVKSTTDTSSAPAANQEQLLSLVEQGKGPPTSEEQDEEEQLMPGTSSTHEYQNDAYTEDATPGGDDPEHVSDHISEYPSVGFNDTASMSIGDVEQDEHLFDVSDLQDREQPIISKCGNLEVSFSYSYEKGRMSISVHRALEIPSKDRGGANNSQIRLLLLPTKKVRNKTKIRPGENPEFNETFSMKVPPEEINNMGVRFRLYGCERMRRERMIGESVVGFASLNQDEETTHMLTLEPRSNLSHGDSNLDVASLSRSDSASSTQSMQHGGMPELLVGLAYNGTTGRLCVEVIKGSNFRNMAMNRAPDTYVKLTLMSPTGQEIARSKTSIRRGQPNPLYKETFMFQVALFQLPEVTLMTSVYNKRSMKRKEMIGWFSLGKNNSGEEELAHWNDMRESKGEQVCRWHVLLES